MIVTYCSDDIKITGKMVPYGPSSVHRGHFKPTGEATDNMEEGWWPAMLVNRNGINGARVRVDLGKTLGLVEFWIDEGETA